jgi:hypothetical protein
MKLFLKITLAVFTFYFCNLVYAQSSQCEGLQDKYSTNLSYDNLTKRRINYPNLATIGLTYSDLPEVQLDRKYCSCSFQNKLYSFTFNEKNDRSDLLINRFFAIDPVNTTGEGKNRKDYLARPLPDLDKEYYFFSSDIKDSAFRKAKDIIINQIGVGNGCGSEENFIAINLIFKNAIEEDLLARKTYAADKYAAQQKQKALNEKFCKGVPKMYLGLYETLSSKWLVNPDSINIKRVYLGTGANYEIACNVVLYTPLGAKTCEANFDQKGAIDRLLSCTN